MTCIARRRLCLLLAAIPGSQLSSSVAFAASAKACPWPAWDAFRNNFVQPDGRVIDHSAEGHSTSEGQTYGLFFALLAGDRTSFSRILLWTRDNLAAGDLTARLMAWRWGRRPDGSWGVLDANAASDADLWLAYTLFQAGRLWGDKQLTTMASAIAERIARELVISLPDIGTILLPGPYGFKMEGGAYKLNPSYQPIFLLRGLAQDHSHGPWTALLRSTVRMLAAVTPKGIAPDWVVVHPKNGFTASTEVGCQGSYDAIRVYLWAGLTSPLAPERALVLKYLHGYANLVEKLLIPPERVDACTGKAESNAPPGFSAALLPFFHEIGAKPTFERLRGRLQELGGLPSIYYERSLGLFSEGWLDKRYRFEVDGRLTLNNYSSLCEN